MPRKNLKKVALQHNELLEEVAAEIDVQNKIVSDLKNKSHTRESTQKRESIIDALEKIRDGLQDNLNQDISYATVDKIYQNLNHTRLYFLNLKKVASNDELETERALFKMDIKVNKITKRFKVRTEKIIAEILASAGMRSMGISSSDYADVELVTVASKDNPFPGSKLEKPKEGGANATAEAGGVYIKLPAAPTNNPDNSAPSVEVNPQLVDITVQPVDANAQAVDVEGDHTYIKSNFLPLVKGDLWQAAYEDYKTEQLMQIVENTPAAELPKLFEKFFKQEASSKNNTYKRIATTPVASLQGLTEDNKQELMAPYIYDLAKMSRNNQVFVSNVGTIASAILKYKKLIARPRAYYRAIDNAMKMQKIVDNYLKKDEQRLDSFLKMLTARDMEKDAGTHKGNFIIDEFNQIKSIDFGTGGYRINVEPQLFTPYDTKNKMYKNFRLEYDKSIIASEKAAKIYMGAGKIKKSTIKENIRTDMEKSLYKNGHLIYGIKPLQKYARQLGMGKAQYNIKDSKELFEEIVKFRTEYGFKNARAIARQGCALALEHCYDPKTGRLNIDKFNQFKNENTVFAEFVSPENFQKNIQVMQIAHHTDLRRKTNLAILHWGVASVGGLLGKLNLSEKKNPFLVKTLKHENKVREGLLNAVRLAQVVQNDVKIEQATIVKYDEMADKYKDLLSDLKNKPIKDPETLRQVEELQREMSALENERFTTEIQNRLDALKSELDNFQKEIINTNNSSPVVMDYLLDKIGGRQSLQSGESEEEKILDFLGGKQISSAAMTPATVKLDAAVDATVKNKNENVVLLSNIKTKNLLQVPANKKVAATISNNLLNCYNPKSISKFDKKATLQIVLIHIEALRAQALEQGMTQKDLDKMPLNFEGNWPKNYLIAAQVICQEKGYSSVIPISPSDKELNQYSNIYNNEQLSILGQEPDQKKNIINKVIDRIKNTEKPDQDIAKDYLATKNLGKTADEIAAERFESAFDEHNATHMPENEKNKLNVVAAMVYLLAKGNLTVNGQTPDADYKVSDYFVHGGRLRFEFAKEDDSDKAKEADVNKQWLIDLIQKEAYPRVAATHATKFDEKIGKYRDVKVKPLKAFVEGAARLLVKKPLHYGLDFLPGKYGEKFLDSKGELQTLDENMAGKLIHGYFNFSSDNNSFQFGCEASKPGETNVFSGEKHGISGHSSGQGPLGGGNLENLERKVKRDGDGKFIGYAAPFITSESEGKKAKYDWNVVTIDSGLLANLRKAYESKELSFAEVAKMLRKEPENAQPVPPEQIEKRYKDMVAHRKAFASKGVVATASQPSTGAVQPASATAADEQAEAPRNRGI